MVRVVVVDDEQLVRSGLRLILGTAPDLEVVADCGGGDAVRTVAALLPDVVLLDIRMPDVDGLTVLRGLRALPRPPAVAMLTTFDADEYLAAALHGGATGFLLKDTDPEQLVRAVRTLAAGGSVLDPAVTGAVIGGYVAAGTGDPGAPGAAAGKATGSAAADRSAAEAVRALTPREREVLAHLGEGLGNQRIAERMGLAPSTVKDHVRAVLAKLGGVNRVQAAIVADRAGLVRPPAGHGGGRA
ncbi:DNA-binding response regulator [Streptomyces mashuensis]|uniref:DNA-binding response regulator n=1 Tax=Streptomyces mashuensis TaxID=33904 RepID=A0A919EC73_9ACTN|nr:response regulator transcription factor [Streptomyces mashuensis]GHF47492.1 DNA-binding response regulator [Streptomyces mashuensis]